MLKKQTNWASGEYLFVVRLSAHDRLQGPIILQNARCTLLVDKYFEPHIAVNPAPPGIIFKSKLSTIHRVRIGELGPDNRFDILFSGISTQCPLALASATS